MTNEEFKGVQEYDIVRVDFDWLPRISIHGKGCVFIKNPDDTQWGDMYVAGRGDDGNMFQGWFARENVAIIVKPTEPNKDTEIVDGIISDLRTAGRI